MKKKIETLSPKEFVVSVNSPTNRQDLLQIFEEERRKIGLLEEDISLLLPEDENYQPDDFLLGNAMGSRERGYSICLFPRTIEENWVDTFRTVIRHELAHIKNGDVDRNLPKILKWIYNSLVEEPRADWYAYFGP